MPRCAQWSSESCFCSKEACPHTCPALLFPEGQTDAGRCHSRIIRPLNHNKDVLAKGWTVPFLAQNKAALNQSHPRCADTSGYHCVEREVHVWSDLCGTWASSVDAPAHPGLSPASRPLSGWTVLLQGASAESPDSGVWGTSQKCDVSKVAFVEMLLYSYVHNTYHVPIRNPSVHKKCANFRSFKN